MPKIRYARGPVVYLYDRETQRKKKWELLWGAFLRIGDDIDDEWSEVKRGGSTFAIRKDDYQEERPLQMIFLDVGQGDGCILTVPERAGNPERILIIDAGQADHMERFLKWRFGGFEQPFRFHAAVITHPDSDHYKGFQSIFDNEKISFDAVYHNGLMERTGDDLLGPVEDGYLTDFRASRTAAHDLYQDESVRGGKWYPKLMWTALQDPDRFGDIAMLSTEHGQKEDGRTWMPGFAPSDDVECTIEVLGPVVGRNSSGRRGLKTFASSLTATAMDEGKTKNGHSVLLRLQYRDFSVLFGGDLNTPAEVHLMRHYGNDGETPTTHAELRAMVDKARRRFAVDLMKCCHHGSADVTNEFLEATAPAAYVISSGDEESHVHPRPELLGLLGRKGRGHRPLLLSTEVLRSTREREKEEHRERLEEISEELADATSEDERNELRKEQEEILDIVFQRNVTTYGAVNLRTDGRKAVIAFRNEKPKGVRRWFYYELEKDADGVFQTVHAGTHH